LLLLLAEHYKHTMRFAIVKLFFENIASRQQAARIQAASRQAASRQQAAKPPASR